MDGLEGAVAAITLSKKVLAFVMVTRKKKVCKDQKEAVYFFSLFVRKSSMIPGTNFFDRTKGSCVTVNVLRFAECKIAQSV